MAEGIPARLSAREGRKFGLPVGGAFLALAGIAWWRERPIVLAVLAALGGALMLAGLVLPTRLGPVQRAWMAFAHAISRVTTPIVMGAVYYLVFTPSGVLLRRFGKNPLARPEGAASFWVDRPSTRERPSSMERQF